MLFCNVCNKQVVKESVSCKDCQNLVAHPSCAAKARGSTRSAADDSILWSCKTCRAEAGSTGSQATEPDLAERFAALEKTVLDAINGRADGHEKRFTEIETSLDMLSSKYDELLKAHQEQKALNKELRKGLETVSQKLQEKDATINQLTARVNQLEQSSLSLTLEVHGIPKSDNENLREKLQGIAGKIGAPAVLDTVSDVYRLPDPSPRSAGRHPRSGAIVVKFKAESARRAWLEGAKRVRRQASTAGGEGEAAAGGEQAAGGANPTAAQRVAAASRPREAQPFRIYEALTSYHRRLLFLARHAGRQAGWQFVWVRDGKIFARHSPQLGALVRIRCEDDIRTKMGMNIATTHI